MNLHLGTQRAVDIPAQGPVSGWNHPLPPSGRPSRLHAGASHAGAQSPSIELYLRLCRVLDTGAAVAVLLGLFVIDNLGRVPTGLDDFLGARLSVKNVILVVTFVTLWHLSCRWAGLYDWAWIRRRRREAGRVGVAASAGTLVALIFPLTSVSGAFRIEVLLPFFALGAASILLARAVLRTTIGVETSGSRHIVIVGTGRRGQELSMRISSENSEAPAHVRFVDSAAPEGGGAGGPPYTLDHLEHLLMTEAADEVLVALPIKSCYAEIQRTIEICERVGVPVKYLADLFSQTRLEPRVERSPAGPIVSVPIAAEGARLAVKRGIDLVGAGAALLLLSPVFLLVGLAVKVTSPGPVLFAQVRYGRGRRRFRMYKFRTMVDGAEELQAELEALNEQKQGPTFKIRRDPRLTRLGALLRRTSLDELPQFWNVLRGDMSLVGPRPMSLRDVELFSEAWLMRRFSVFPGITGLWQVSGRSDLPFDEWIRLDLAYIDNWSLTLDLKILLRTLPAVLSGTGAA